jgi:hypothetical protein
MLRASIVSARSQFWTTVMGWPQQAADVAMWQWSGGPFDPAGFDANATNAALRRLR